MSEVEEALHNAAKMGFQAAKNGENLEEVLKDIKVTKGAEA